MTKPIRYKELAGVMTSVLSKVGGRVESISAPQPVAPLHAVHDACDTRQVMNMFVGRNVRILLAEDNITNQQVAIGMLKKLGLSVNAVSHGAEALKAVETIPYDLVFMDIQMPVMDGVEATRKIRDVQSRRSQRPVPVIAMTAHAMQGDRTKYLEAGMDDYLTKPLRLGTLVEILEKWLPEETAAMAATPDKTNPD